MHASLLYCFSYFITLYRISGKLSSSTLRTLQLSCVVTYSNNKSVCKMKVGKLCIFNTYLKQGCQHCLSKKSGNFANCLMYVLPPAIGLPRHMRSQLGGGASRVFVWDHRNFLQNRVKIVEF